MTEAFEIGVSLALQDGVSDAIGKARRDVAALEHAVLESGVSVRSLRDAGTKASSVAFSDGRHAVADEPVTRVVQEAAPAAVRPAVPATISPLLGAAKAVTRDVGAQEGYAPVPARVGQEGDMTLPHASNTGPDDATGIANIFVGAPALGQGLEPLAAGAPSVSAGGVAPAGKLADQAEAASAGRGTGMAPVAMPAREEASPAPLGVVAVPAGAGAPLMGHFTDARDFSMPLPALSTSQADTQENGGYVSLLSALRLSGGSADVGQSEDRGAAPSDDISVGNDAAQSGLVQQAPDFVTRREGGAPPVGLAAPQGARAQNAPEQADRREGGPQEGDVFLDGMLVGRWISKFLNREAGRASSGPTGFDARRGQLLPGVTVGS